MFGKGMYFSVFHCLYYVTDISTDILEEKEAEERYPELNEEEDIRLDDIREEHWRDVDEEGDDKEKIHDLRRRQIALGVGKTADESMSAIQFCTPPKGDLPH